MPQMVATRRLGVALDHGMIKQPAPVYMDLKKNNSREYRRDKPDYDNMLLAEPMTDNRIDDSKWQGNGFAGNFQFVPYFGKKALRGGEKLTRDIQIDSLVFDNERLLNTSMLRPEAAASVQFSSMPTEEQAGRHSQAMTSMRTLRSHAAGHHRAENPHEHARNELHLSMQRQARMMDQSEAIKGLRSAGLASINPRMGTCGSLPDIRGLAGKEGLNHWRSSTPWSLDPALDAPASYTLRYDAAPPSFVHPR
eukprot:TRINITY_DN23235_c0_g1_i1.p1 TRINITY_DN23235_c0_g1~~TRINITY_DN23235_c0_g1_i1.p1  ORF type:complete len:251 (+),score=56.26 TRINITY_DN23235_c0_g1_i1:60-812(+)